MYEAKSWFREWVGEGSADRPWDWLAVILDHCNLLICVCVRASGEHVNQDVHLLKCIVGEL